MPKSLILGNGNILVGFDQFNQVKDFYFPYVSMENHAGTHCTHMIGVWVDESFSWLSDGSWQKSQQYKQDALVGDTYFLHEKTKISLHFTDAVHHEHNYLLRKISIKNHSKQKKEVRLFINHQFDIHGDKWGDTAYYDPRNQTIIHYKGKRVFLIGGVVNDTNFDRYTIGSFRSKGKEGTYRDAEDGELSANAIDHGSVDSTIGFTIQLDTDQEDHVYYWMCVGKSIREVQIAQDHIRKKTVPQLLTSTTQHWQGWLNRRMYSFVDLPEDCIKLFNTSLLLVRAHIDNRGAVIASSDSDMLQHGEDTYTYMWPRDGAFAVMALDRAGYGDITKTFFEFCNGVITEEGYLMHKYNADRSLASSWHPWVRNGSYALPIQEDETALVITALLKHYDIHRDIDFLEALYGSLVRKAAIFMTQYIDEQLGLPQPSYDLWEEKWGTSTFTASAVYSGLMSASRIAQIVGKQQDAEIFQNFAKQIRTGIMNHMFDAGRGIFIKQLARNGNEIIKDKTVDISSIFGVIRFGIINPDDPRIPQFLATVEQILSKNVTVGGIIRYENDQYYRRSGDETSNPWFITTLWLSQLYIMHAKKIEDFHERTFKTLQWCIKFAQSSGMLSEQIDPHTGAMLSVSPLTWSHAEFVTTILDYVEKMTELGIQFPIINGKRLPFTTQWQSSHS